MKKYSISRLVRIARLWLAIKFPRLRKRILTEHEHERLTLLEFRMNAAWFGFSVDNMTDDELTRGVAECHSAIAKVGLTIEECGRAIEIMRDTALKTCIYD